jgi:hypothetical protein
MNGTDWETEFLDGGCSSGQRRTAYSANSPFIIVYSEKGAVYDREELGEAIFANNSFGCIDPPGPVGGFGKFFSQELLEASEGKFTLRKIRDISAPENVLDELVPHLDGIFLANVDEKTFEEKPLSYEYLASIFSGDPDNRFIEIIEYEPD